MQEPVGDILEQGHLVSTWFIPVVRSYKYHKWYDVYKSNNKIYYLAQGQVNDNMFRPFTLMRPLSGQTL